MPTFFFFFYLLLLLLSCATTHLICASTLHHHRRILHQPFVPVNSSSSPPQPQPQQHPQSPQPKFPFSSTTPNKQPFFPSYPSPPPPSSGSSSAAATFPANISDLIFPQAPRHKPISPKVVAISVILALFSSAFLISIALLLYCRKRRTFSSTTTTTKTSRSDSHRLFPKNAAAQSNHKSASATSSEFLYLGTLVNSHGVDSGDAAATTNEASPYRKLGSPELQPLPPLSRQNLKRGGEEQEEEEEEFYSPRGSSGEKESLGFNGSGSRRTFTAVEVENFGSIGGSSSTTPYPISPTRSISNSLSPPLPPKSKSPSPANQSPARNSGVSRVPPPPPPPPPPPSGFWEAQPQPVRPAQIREPTIFRPPVLITPSKPLVFQNPAAVSPGELTQNLASVEKNEETPKPKLKPLHWDKVRASSDRAMVWDQLKSSSFQLNEEMIETLFVVKAANGATPKGSHWRPVLPLPNQENMVLDPKKSQNIAILLRALNVTIEEVCEALLEGNADTLGTDLLESLLKMAPTKEEERKLKEYDDSSPFKLGSAEKFLKAVLDIPFAFKRVEAMLYIANFDSEVDYLKRSFATLEAACEELRNSKMFLKLLEAVLKTGNRMNVGTNRGDAQAFKLDTLLKLVDVKGTDGKTTLLHFVVQEIIRAEGSRLSGAKQNSAVAKTVHSGIQNDMEFRKLGLQVVAGLGGELTNVKKAAAMDSEVLSSEVSKLARGIANIGEVLRLNESTGSQESSRRFSESMNDFLKKAEEEIIRIQAQENVALSLVKEITEYFHGNSAKEEAHPFRFFLVVRDFLSILDQVCKEVGKINERTTVSSARQFPVPVNPTQQPVFPRFHTPQQYSSDDDESLSLII